jgi:hypothetical protein
MSFESGRKPEVPWNKMQCESDIHIVDFLRKIFFGYLSMVFIGLLTAFLTGFLVGFLK